MHAAGLQRCERAAAEAELVAEFERRYRTQYGFLMPDKALIIEAVAVEAIGANARVEAVSRRDGAVFSSNRCAEIRARQPRSMTMVL